MTYRWKIKYYSDLNQQEYIGFVRAKTYSKALDKAFIKFDPFDHGMHILQVDNAPPVPLSGRGE